MDGSEKEKARERIRVRKQTEIETLGGTLICYCFFANLTATLAPDAAWTQTPPEPTRNTRPMEMDPTALHAAAAAAATASPHAFLPSSQNVDDELTLTTLPTMPPPPPPLLPTMLLLRCQLPCRPFSLKLFCRGDHLRSARWHVLFCHVVFFWTDLFCCRLKRWPTSIRG